MIRYALQCDRTHAFEAWFGSSADYDDQHARGLVECPFCGSKDVGKQIMAPAVRGTKAQVAPAERLQQMQTVMMEAAGQLRKHVEDNFDYVGGRFAREARDIHDGEAPERAIYGEASPQEVRELVEDGVRIAPLPPTPRPAKPQLN